MKTVIDTTAHPGGGTMRYFRNVVPRFAGDGDEYVVLAPRGRSGPFDLTTAVADADNVTVRDVPVGPDTLLLRVLFQQFVLPALLYRWGADVLFSPGDMTAMLAPCPVVLMIHNPNPYYDSFGDFTYRSRVKFALLRYLTWVSSLKAARIVFVSESSRAAVIDSLGIPVGKTEVIYHGVNRDFFDRPDASDGDGTRGSPSAFEQYEPYILTVSTVLPHKNYETLLRAFDGLSGNLDEDYTLLVAGRQPSEEYFDTLNRMKAGLKHGDSVHFLGEVPDDALRDLYRNADVYVLPSRVETFGMTVLEAMASGTPVVAADATSLPEVGGDAAVYFATDDADQLAEIVGELVADDEYRDSLATRGRTRAEEFTWDRTATRTKAALTRAAGAEGAG